jgi:transposase
MGVRSPRDGNDICDIVCSKNIARQGDQIDALADRHGVVEKTNRNWLDRFLFEPIKQAPYDEPRPGRPSKLADDQCEQLFEQLQHSSTELGYEQQAWSPKLLLHHVKEDSVEYSKGHARKFLSKAGLSCSQVFGMCINNWLTLVHYVTIKSRNNPGGYSTRLLKILNIYSA